MKKITYPVNEGGYVIGQHHHRAKLTDEQVELVHQLYEEECIGYRAIARFFGVNFRYIRDIVTFRRRSTTPAAYRSGFADENGKRIKLKRHERLADGVHN